MMKRPVLAIGLCLSLAAPLFAQSPQSVDATGRPVESIRRDLGAMTRGGLAFGGVLTTAELRQGRIVRGKRLDFTSGATREAFVAHWGDDFVVGGPPGVLQVISKNSRRCAAVVNRPVTSRHISGPFFDAVRQLMVAEGIATSDVPGSTFGTPTSSIEAATAVIVDSEIAPGTTMIEALNSLVDASKVERFGWLIIERGNGEPEQCQLSFMFNDGAIWTSYDISRGLK